MIHALGRLYGAAAMWRRDRMLRHPSRVRHLARPVISVGNLRLGGSGKTPAVGYIARLLLDAGERPAILSRGYARQIPSSRVTVVSDGLQVRGSLAVSGDEPLMLARAVPGAIVLVGANRYASGRLAEDELGATVHVLDDGFQHYQLGRDVDLLLLSEEDLTDEPVPAGRLREPLAAARHATAALVDAGYLAAAERVARAAGIPRAFCLLRALYPPHTLAGEPVLVPPSSRVFVLTGIARPERFLADVASAGWQVVGSMAFRDHHQFTRSDLARIGADAGRCAASIVLTTEKDAIRLAAFDSIAFPLAAVPLAVTVEPADRFRDWLLSEVRRKPEASLAG